MILLIKVGNVVQSQTVFVSKMFIFYAGRVQSVVQEPFVDLKMILFGP